MILVTRHVDTILIAIYVPHAHEHHMTMACIVLLYRLNWCLVSSQKTYLIGFAQLAILFCACLAVILKERHTYDIAGTAEPGWRTIPGHPLRHSSNSVMKFLTCLGDATGGGWKYACCSIYFNTKYHETVFIEGFFCSLQPVADRSFFGSEVLMQATFGHEGSQDRNAAPLSDHSWPKMLPICLLSKPKVFISDTVKHSIFFTFCKSNNKKRHSLFDRKAMDSGSLEATSAAIKEASPASPDGLQSLPLQDAASLSNFHTLLPPIRERCWFVCCRSAIWPPA